MNSKKNLCKKTNELSYCINKRAGYQNKYSSLMDKKRTRSIFLYMTSLQFLNLFI